MKSCSSCQVEYEPYGQRCSLCKECRRAYDRQYHAKRSTAAKQRKLDVQRAARIRNSQFVYDYFKSNPCVGCGETRIPCLQFDHVGDKSHTVSDMVKGYSLANIKEEISKCRVLCANCHAVRTAEQFGWYSNVAK